MTSSSSTPTVWSNADSKDLDIGLARLRAAAEEPFEREVAAVADGILHALRDPEGRDDVALVVKRLADLA